MKKILAFTLSLILTAGAFTGCGSEDGNAKEKSGKSSSSSKKYSKSDLDDTASTLLKAANSALISLDESNISIYDGYIASDGDCTSFSGDDYGKFTDELKNFFYDADNYEYVIVVDNWIVSEMYVAESIDSDVIGTYPEGLETDGTLEDIKNSLAEKLAEDETTEEETSDNATSDAKTFGFTVEEFEKDYNSIVPEELFNNKITISKTGTDVGEKLTIHSYEINYKINDVTISLKLYSDNDGYVSNINLSSDASIGYFITADGDSSVAIEFVKILLSPYLVINKGSNYNDILTLFNSMESTENGDMVTSKGNDGKFSYSITTGFGTIVNITPNK